MKRENDYQAKLIKKLKKMFPGCMVLKNDANYIQGIPDLLVLFKNMWAALECKRSKGAPHQPNQDFYIDKLCEMSFASLIYPENETEVLNELQQAFKLGESTRISESK